MPPELDDGCKLDRVAAERELSGIDNQLATRRAEGASLRELAGFYNRRVVGAALTAAGVDPVAGEATALYRLLTDDDVSPGDRLDAEARLRRLGIDPEALTDDFVSHVTVRRHLADCLDIEISRESTIDIDDASTTVMKLLSRVESVTRQTLDRLEQAGLVEVTAPSVTVSLRVSCGQCEEAYSFSRLLERGSCGCSQESAVGETAS